MCRKAIPLAMSSANFTAWLWSTTRADDEGGNGGRSDKETWFRALGLKNFIDVHKLLTGALVEYVEEGPIWHVRGDDDGVRGRRGLTGAKNRQNVGV